MIALLAVAVVLAQSMPALPPAAPLRENQAPVAQSPAPFAIPEVAGIDRTFALAALQGNAAEIELSRLALRRAASPDVKAFAQKMITEQAGLADEMLPALTRVLSGRSLEALAAPDALALAHLQTISDVDFDHVYAEQQIGDHLATLTAFQTEADNGTDPQLKMLVRRWLPTIEAHLQLAVSLTQHIGGASPFKSH